jgi:geranylgeranylglycerol-phosphate geranylgeranyltransferase
MCLYDRLFLSEKIQKRRIGNSYIENQAMHSLLPYLKIARLHNALMAGIAVALGFWLSRSALPLTALALLVIAAIGAVAFGNIINDIKDLASDRISHPGRPLPRNELSPAAAGWYAAYCAFLSITGAAFMSPAHTAATVVPLVLLAVYTLFLKATPLAGNIVVSLLVAYPLCYGGLSAPAFSHLVIPAFLAFLLNLVREIIKDLQDEQGDRSAGVITTASLPSSIVKGIVYALIVAYLLSLFAPAALHHFGKVYTIICAVVIVPLQLVWLFIFAGKSWRSRLSVLSLLIKFEMVIGLTALAADQLFNK